MEGPRRFAPLQDLASSSPCAEEEAVLRGWRERGTFGAVQRARAGAEPFVFWEGPPTANGRPGIHHVLSRTVKDAFCRYWTMRGRRVDRKAGWDTHGLPVELEVEKKLGISGKQQIEAYGIARFNEECRKSVWTYKKEWEELSERIGFWLDYERPYVTYEPDYVESVWHLLALFHSRGLAYRGRRVLPYCGRCGTGLSSHELGQPGVYRDVSDPSVVVAFLIETPARGMPPPIRHEHEAFLAWTTTPWTLPANFALAVNPALTYVRARVQKGDRSRVVWVGADRADAVLPDGYEILEQRKGLELVGSSYQPLFLLNLGAQPDTVPSSPPIERMYRVHAADFVTTAEGTGIVHQAAYGDDDWKLATREGVPTNRGPGEDGRFDTPVYERSQQEASPVVERGTWFKDADAPVLTSLKRRELLFTSGHATHSYPHCWRCSTPLYYFPAPAWYLRTTALKERMVELNRRVRWVPPEVGEKRFGEWLENNVDWNISRDRYWGTPLPFWVCEGCAAEKAVGSVADLERLAGDLPAGFDLHRPAIDDVTFPCERCGKPMRRTKAVLDCWFDSGAMPFAQHHWPWDEGARAQFPADFIAEGLDQTRGWFYTLHAIGAFVTSLGEGGFADGPAYRTCVVNGLVLDKDGVKMSKRLGNVVDPWAVIREQGADALRWYLVSGASPWLPRRFDPEGVVEVRRRFLGTLSNSYRFLAEYARIDRFDPGAAGIPAVAGRPEIDRWLVSRTHSTVGEARARMEEFDLAGACRALEALVIDDLSNWYIRRTRRRFWKGGTGADKLAAFATLHAALATASRLLAPLAPFAAEMLWARLEGRGSVHEQDYPEADARLLDRRLEESMRVVTGVVELGRALRERSGLRIRQPLRAIHVRSGDARSLELLRTPFATELVLGELNVKAWGSLEADDGRVCRLRAKANFRTLGKRLGGRMKAAAAAIEALPRETVVRLRAGETVEVELPDGRLALAPDDVLVTVESQPGLEVETDGRLVVFLDTELDEALLAEGLAREAVSRINGLRKEAGLAVEDRVRLWLRAEGSERLAQALSEHAELIRGETLAVESSLGAGPAGVVGGVEREYDLGEGGRLGVVLVKA